MTSVLPIRHPSQRVAYPFFIAAAALFLLQVLFGLLLAAQYVWPALLVNELPFNVARATHLNLLVLWSLLGLMGATYYLVPDETDSDLFSVALAYVQLALMLVAGVAALAGFWFFGLARGKPFTEAAMPWPWVIAFGAVLFLVNIGVTLFRAKKWNAITTVLFAGMAGLAVLYLINMLSFANLAVDYYWWWWIIHLWVEGTWELVAAAIMAYLLILVTGVERARMYRWLYLEVSLVLFTGIIGIGHHYYWIGTPSYWLVWGAVFSFLEPIPLALMAYDALISMKRRNVAPTSRVAWYWVGGTAIAHFLGAGVWGIIQTLPQVNRWTHGTQITASHGHFAFFGAIGMLVIAAAYTMLPRLTGAAPPALARERRGMWAFWLMTTGMLAMVAAFTVAGIVQVYLWRMLGLDFMMVRTEFVSFWMFWVGLCGALLFLPGAVLYLRDLFALTRPVLR